MEFADVTVEEITERRWHRVGSCPVLEVCVVYPRLRIAEGEPSTDRERFNHAYARMAEAFLSWAEGDPARRAAEAFATMGAGAAYRFDRRLLLCKMTVAVVRRTPSDTGGYLRVTRQTSRGRRRMQDHEKIVLHEDFWRIPDMTLTRRCPCAECPDGEVRVENDRP